MATEITPGAENVLESLAKALDHSRRIEERFDPHFTDHDPAEGQPQGGGGLAWYWAGFEASFSNVERRIIETVATPSHVVTVMDLSGTHTGEWMGHAPTGKRFTVRNVQVMGLRDGLPVDRWGSTDQLGMMQQLGLIPAQDRHS
jgi:predicted ester cyclase